MSKQEPIPAPSEVVRLTWWLAIFLSGFVPILLRAFENQYSLSAVAFFPITLGFILVPLANLLPEPLAQCLMLLAWFAGIAFYTWHFYATSRASTRRRFQFLLLLLVAVIILNQLIFWGMGGVSG